nr:signal peptidase II [Candidatus Rhodoblastus alkanivorans]
MSPQARRRFAGFAVAAAVLAADQASKYWAIRLLDGPDHPGYVLTPFLALVMSWNRGIAYTMLQSDGDFGRFALVGVALAAVGLLIFWLWRARGLVSSIAFGCLIGGALGNAADRVTHGAVADFLYFHTPFSLGPLSNYVFNLADAAIFVGVVLLVYDATATRDVAIGEDHA